MIYLLLILYRKYFPEIHESVVAIGVGPSLIHLLIIFGPFSRNSFQIIYIGRVFN